MAQLAGAAEYTDSISADWSDFPNKCPEYDTKQSDGEASVMLELWVMWSTHFIAIFPRFTFVVASDRVLSMGQVELFDI